MENKLETAVFGGGCFWCTEAIFQSLRGVVSVSPGYCGGSKPNPSYEEVCAGTTGHAEVIKIEFDPKQISFTELLEVLFATHDPTSVNRQGGDIGEQYRSVIFFTSPSQQSQAQEVIRGLEMQEVFPKPIATQIKPLQQFFPAEDYHKNYFANNPANPYCQVVINPKLQKFKTKFASLLK